MTESSQGGRERDVSPSAAEPVVEQATAEARLRLALVVSHPIQHFCPMYREIARDPRVQLLVIFVEAGAEPRFDADFGVKTQWQDDILEGYDHLLLGAPPEQRPKAVAEALERFGAQAVYVHGYTLNYLRAAMRWARRAGAPVLLTTDNELLHRRPWHVRAAKRVLLPMAFRRVTLFLTVGDENERAYAHYGVPASRFRRVTFSIDSAYYDPFVARREEVRTQVRERLGIAADAVVLLNVGKMILHKEQADLVAAFAEATRQTDKPTVLLLAGDGPERKRLEAQAAALGEAVQFLGFVRVQDLPEYYLAADGYVHPSSIDPHPLAISEAIYCGLPVVASDLVGSIGATDDVQPGRNGWSYRAGDRAQLAAILLALIDDVAGRAAKGRESRQLGLVHRAPAVAKAFVDAVIEVSDASDASTRTLRGAARRAVARVQSGG